MTNVYMIWREDEDKADASKHFGDCAEYAIERWAQNSDASSAEYLIANGQLERVFCALNEENAGAELFVVSGEAVPVYSAMRITQ